jgi:exopolysaccharide biosynthesis polyprenyl glycosylphosphotransferase
MTNPRRATLVFLGLDIASVAIIVNVIAWLRGIFDFNGLILLPLVVPVMAVLIALYLIDGYRLRTDMLSLDYASQHAIALLAAMAGALLLTFVIMPFGYPLQQSRVVLASTSIVLIPLTLGYRRLLNGYYRQLRATRSVVFIGDQASAASFKKEWDRIGMLQPLLFASGQTGATVPPMELPIGAPLPFSEIIARMRRGELLVEAMVIRESNRAVNAQVSQQLVDLYFTGTPTYTLELFHQVYWRKIPLYRLNQTWLFQEGFRVAREPVFEHIKRASDVGFALFGLLVSSPALLLIALAIWAEDHGSVFFTQTRIGKFRVPFKLYKFRTMRPTLAGDPYAQPGDMRITRVGKFLRSARLDELPQLINVLRGQMSLIGPRAEWDRLVENYDKLIPSYHFRHLVRPGITGWAQVNYPYGANLEDTERKLEYDLYYIRHFSFRLDASIVLKTIHVMIGGKGR